MGISILQASKSWGVSRTTIHDKINRGELSRLNDKTIDPSEMSRVFGQPKKLDSVQNTKKVQQRTPLNTELLEQKILFLEDQKNEAIRRAERAEERENKLLNQLDNLTNAMKLLEAPKAETVQTRPPEPTYTTPPQPIREYSQWEEQPRKKRSLFSTLARSFLDR